MSVTKSNMMFVWFVAVSGMELSPGKIIRCSCMFVQKSHRCMLTCADLNDRPLVAQKCIACKFWRFSFLPCRWSHSYSDRSDVRLRRFGCRRSLHREDDTVRRVAAASRISQWPLLADPVDAATVEVPHSSSPFSQQILYTAPPWSSRGEQVVYLVLMLTVMHLTRLTDDLESRSFGLLQNIWSILWCFKCKKTGSKEENKPCLEWVGRSVHDSLFGL